MRQMEIRAQLSKPWTITTKDSDFSTELQNILDEQFNPDRPNAVWCSDITYIWTIDGYVAKEYKKATENMQRSYSKKAFP